MVIGSAGTQEKLPLIQYETAATGGYQPTSSTGLNLNKRCNLNILDILLITVQLIVNLPLAADIDLTLMEVF